jgi:NO-binding membrane sensor protein with MHYT domain
MLEAGDESGDAMTDGLILLALIGVITAFATVRVRRKMGIASNAKTWTAIIVGTILVGLTIWAASTH